MPVQAERPLVVDWGSSKISVSARPNSPAGIVANYTRTIFSGNENLPPMAYIGPEDLEQKLRAIQGAAVGSKVVGITGLSHSIVTMVQNGVERVAMVGDEPSLTPRGGLPKQLHPYYLEADTRPSSAVRKLAGLLEHPELMDVLFGRNWEGNVRYTTLLSLAAARILGNPDLAIAPDEAADFFRGVNNSQGKNSIPDRFGLSPHQLVFGEESVIRANGREVWIMQDLHAEMKVLKELFDKRLIPQGAWIMATDSVLKRIRSVGDLGTSQMEGLYYDTMRMMGNTGLNRVLPLVKERGLANDVGAMFGYFEASLRDTSLPLDWFYDPRANNNQGGVWRKDGRDGWRQMETADILTDSTIDVIEVIRAYGWGMAAAMYEGIPEDVADIVIYGGLMCLHGEMQQGWRHVFTQAAPGGPQIYWLGMPDSRVALEMLIRADKGEVLDYGKEVPVVPIEVGGGEHARWQDMKADVSAHDRMR